MDQRTKKLKLPLKAGRPGSRSVSAAKKGPLFEFDTQFSSAIREEYRPSFTSKRANRERMRQGTKTGGVESNDWPGRKARESPRRDGEKRKGKTHFIVGEGSVEKRKKGDPFLFKEFRKRKRQGLPVPCERGGVDP